MQDNIILFVSNKFMQRHIKPLQNRCKKDIVYVIHVPSASFAILSLSAVYRSIF